MYRKSALLCYLGYSYKQRIREEEDALRRHCLDTPFDEYLPYRGWYALTRELVGRNREIDVARAVDEYIDLASAVIGVRQVYVDVREGQIVTIVQLPDERVQASVIDMLVERAAAVVSRYPKTLLRFYNRAELPSAFAQLPCWWDIDDMSAMT